MFIDSQQSNVPQFCKIFMFFALLSGEGQIVPFGVSSQRSRVLRRKEREGEIDASNIEENGSTGYPGPGAVVEPGGLDGAHDGCPGDTRAPGDA
jgi:hypothetical protein